MTGLGWIFRRGVRAPAVHFVLLGGLLFALHRWVAPGTVPRRMIALSASAIDGLREDHRQRHGVPPTAEEETQMVRRLVDDELLYREALALGLDRGDIIVRRRLVQKMEFVSERSAKEPTDKELEDYLAVNRERYQSAAAITFEHVFVGRDRHADPAGVARRLAEELGRGQDPARVGDPFLRGRELVQVTQAQVAAVFGGAFAAKAMGLDVGVWSSPMPSSYGLHLLRVHEKVPARLPDLAEVRGRALSDLRENRRAQNRRAELERLRARYDVRVDGKTPVLAKAVNP